MMQSAVIFVWQKLYKDSESREKMGTCSHFSEVHPIQDYVKDTNKPSAKANLFVFFRGGIIRIKIKDTE